MDESLSRKNWNIFHLVSTYINELDLLLLEEKEVNISIIREHLHSLAEQTSNET